MLIEPLTPEEARVLGTLLEKSLATPDYYPMTLNALRIACNQKTNREPVSEFEDAEVSEALAGLKRKCLVTFIPYGSGGQHKYRHFLEDVRFNLRKPDLAVLAVLLLRGAQTLNEARVRASSLHPLESLEAAEEVLKNLAGRAEPLAELLPKRSGWKEPRWRDTLCPREEGADGDRSARAEAREGLLSAGAPAQSHSPAAAAPHGSDLLTVPQGHSPAAARADEGALRGEVEALKREVAELKAAYAALKDSVDKLRADLY